MSNRDPISSNPSASSNDPFARATDESFPPRTDVLDTSFADQNQNQSSGQSGSGSSGMKDKAQEKAGQAQEVVEQAQAKAGEVAGKAQAKAGEVGEQLHSRTDKGIDSAASGLGQAAGMLRQQGEGREGTVGTAAAKTADTLETASAYLHEKDTDQLVSDLEALVRRKPVESVLVAAGIGFVLSKIVR